MIDRYEDWLHVTEYERPHDRDPAEHVDWLELMLETASEALGVPRGKVIFKSRKRQRGDEQYERMGDEQQIIEAHEGGLRFLVNLTDYVDTGLFLDHRITRAKVRELADRKSVV